MASSQGLLRDRVSSHGTFLSVPAVFQGADEGIKHAFKLEFCPVIEKTVGSGKDTEHSFGTVCLSDRALIDLGAVQPDAVDFKKAARDCELLQAALEKHPDVLRQVLIAVAGSGQQLTDIQKVAEKLEELELTELHFHEQGGGILALLLLACALALCAGCATCAGTTRPPEHPQTLPADAGTD